MIKKIFKSRYNDKYLNEIRTYLQRDFSVDHNNIDVLLKQFSAIMTEDPEYVFHYDSEYWAKYIAEASGLVSKKIFV